MRLTAGACPKDVTEIQEFAEWILKVKDDELGEHYDGEISIDLPGEILIDAFDDPVFTEWTLVIDLISAHRRPLIFKTIKAGYQNTSMLLY
ncbi:hypothetical protein Tco_1315992 [Tanacetum coccineum]